MERKKQDPDVKGVRKTPEGKIARQCKDASDGTDCKINSGGQCKRAQDDSHVSKETETDKMIEPIGGNLDILNGAIPEEISRDPVLLGDSQSEQLQLNAAASNANAK